MESVSSSTPPLSTRPITPIDTARSDTNIAHAIANVTNSPEKIQFFDNPLISKGFFEALDNVLDCDLTFNDRANLFDALPQDHAQEVSRHYAVKNGNQLQKIWNDKIIESDRNAAQFLIACSEATDKKIDLNVFNEHENNALITAVKQRKKVVVLTLLETSNINVNICSEEYYSTALIVAAQSKNTDIVRLLLENGADINLTNYCNDSALMIATADGHFEIVELLLTTAGIAINTQQKYCRYTALIKAAELGHTKIIQLLLENGADINLTDYCNNSALMMATQSGHTEIVQLLLDKGADINLTNNRNENALIMAVKKDFQNIVELLLAKPDIYCGYTALIKAAELGHTKIIQLLLENGADINLTDYYNNSALMMATQSGHTEIVQLLLDKGADINRTNNRNENALIMAVKKDFKNIVELLLAKPDIVLDTRRKFFNDTALTLAIIRNHEEIVQLLMKKNADIHHTEDELKNAHRIATILSNRITDIANDSIEIKTRVMMEFQKIQIEYDKVARQRVAEDNERQRPIQPRQYLHDLIQPEIAWENMIFRLGERRYARPN
jgi:ankyrin repeat protein